MEATAAANEATDRPALVSTDEVAARFDTTPNTVRRLVREGRIPAYQVGKNLRYDLDEVRVALRCSP